MSDSWPEQVSLRFVQQLMVELALVPATWRDALFRPSRLFPKGLHDSFGEQGRAYAQPQVFAVVNTVLAALVATVVAGGNLCHDFRYTCLPSAALFVLGPLVLGNALLLAAISVPFRAWQRRQARLALGVLSYGSAFYLPMAVLQVAGEHALPSAGRLWDWALSGDLARLLAPSRAAWMTNALLAVVGVAWVRCIAVGMRHCRRPGISLRKSAGYVLIGLAVLGGARAAEVTLRMAPMAGTLVSYVNAGKALRGGTPTPADLDVYEQGELIMRTVADQERVPIPLRRQAQQMVLVFIAAQAEAEGAVTDLLGGAPRQGARGTTERLVRRLQNPAAFVTAAEDWAEATAAQPAGSSAGRLWVEVARLYDLWLAETEGSGDSGLRYGALQAGIERYVKGTYLPLFPHPLSGPPRSWQAVWVEVPRVGKQSIKLVFPAPDGLDRRRTERE